jgi:hypothetical protein
MSPETSRSLLWLPGPLIAVALVLLALLGRGGPGFFLLAIVGGAAFMFGAPIVQLILLTTPRFKGRYSAACRVALVIVALALCIPIVAGSFSFA